MPGLALPGDHYDPDKIAVNGSVALQINKTLSQIEADLLT